MSDQRYTQEQLTASDGRVWTPEEVEMMAKWWLIPSATKEFFDLEAVMSKCEGFEKWIDLPDPPAVDLEVERHGGKRYDSP
jgi:hypothetical protein